MVRPNTEAAPPSEPGAVTRRTALKLAAVGGFGLVAGLGASAAVTQWGQSASQRYRFFSKTEADLLIAICEQIIPRDDTPGATDAGVIHYIDRQICGPLVRHQQSYRVGLEAFRKTCIALYQTPFEKLAFERQTEALRRIEAGNAPKALWGDTSPQAFFGIVLDHTRQGFYGSPRHGGNRDYVGYRIMGLAAPNFLGPDHAAMGHPAPLG